MLEYKRRCDIENTIFFIEDFNKLHEKKRGKIALSMKNFKKKIVIDLLIFTPQTSYYKIVGRGIDNIWHEKS